MLLLKRGESYYFRWQIPHDLRSLLGARELVRSLYTSDKLIAESRAAPLKLIVRRIKALRVERQMTKQGMSDEQVFAAMEENDNQRLNDPRLIALSEENYLEALAALWEQARSEINYWKNYRFKNGDIRNAVKNNFQQNKNNFKDVLSTDLGSLDSDDNGAIADYISDCVNELAEVGYRVDRSEKWPQIDEFLKQYITLRGYVSEEIEKDLNKQKDDVEFFPPKELKGFLSTGDGIKLFSIVHDEFLSFKIKENNLSLRMQKDYLRFFADWTDLMEDKGMALYAIKEIRDYLKTLLGLPKRNCVPYKGLPVKELVAMDGIPDEDLISQKTIGQVEKWLQGVFNFSRQRDYSSHSPASALGLNLNTRNPYSDFSDVEVNRMLSESQKYGGWKFFVIWIAAYTGMRLGEIVQLMAEDIKQDDDSERFYIMVTDDREGQVLKTRNSKRKVVIHKKLIDIGLLELVKSSSGRLFPGIESQKVTKWFPLVIVRDCRIPRVDEFGARRVFHSFRHTVITKFYAANCSGEKIRQLVGHEKGRTDVHTGYVHHIGVKDLVDTMDALKY